MREYDVVVVGAGLSGGLPAAAYLQKAGARVALVERGIEAGRYYLSYELLPGLRFDHSPVNFSGMSPAVLDLDLARYGYELRPTEIIYATIDREGRSATVYSDLDRTVEELAAHSPADAEAFRELLDNVAAEARRLAELLFYTPHPDPAALEEAIELTAAVVGIDRAELERLDAPGLVARLFTSDFVRRTVMALPALNLFGDLLVPRQGALTWVWSLLLRSAVAPAGNASLVKALERAFVAEGGTLLRATTATELLVEDGRCIGVAVDRGGARETLRATGAVVSNLGGPLTGSLLRGAEGALAGEEQRAFLRRLDGFETRARVITVHDLVARRPLTWKAPNPDLARSPRVYLLWDDFEACRGWLEQSRRADDAASFFGDIEITQFGAIYGAREDLHPVRVRYGTGPYLFDDDGDDWDAVRGEFAERMLELLREYDPGFPEAVVCEQLATPLDFWRSNPAARHGNPVGGDLVEQQWIEDRLPYRTPISGLYLSNGVWPPGLSLMAGGYNAATVVAEDLGIRDHEWWSSPPGAAHPSAAAVAADPR